MEGSLLPKDPDSPDVLMVMITENTTQTRTLPLPIAQIKEIILLTLEQSEFNDGEFNSYAQDKTARVVYKNRTFAKVHNITLSGDFLSWNEGFSQKRVHISEINYVSFTSHGRGAWQGLGMGLLFGEGVGLIAYLTSSHKGGNIGDLSPLLLLFGPAVFGPIGLVFGTAAGSHTVYVFAGN